MKREFISIPGHRRILMPCGGPARVATHSWGGDMMTIVSGLMLLTGSLALSQSASNNVKGPECVTPKASLQDLPYRHVGFITPAEASGSVVYDERLILTAAHVVCDNQGRLDIHGAKWHLSYNGSDGRSPKGGKAIRGAWIFLGQGYAGYSSAISNGENAGFSRDIAVCIASQGEKFSEEGTLPWKLNNRPAPMVEYASDTSLQKMIVGYPGHHCDGYMYMSSATDDVYDVRPEPQPLPPLDHPFRWSRSSDPGAEYNLSSSWGMSGGPLLVDADGEQAVVGVHVAGDRRVPILIDGCKSAVSQTPGARMLTQEVEDQLLKPAKKAANARITSPIAVTWPVGQQSTYQLAITGPSDTTSATTIGAAYFKPTRYKIEGKPTWMQVEPASQLQSKTPPETPLLRLVGTPQSNETAEVTIIAWDEVHDADSANRPPTAPPQCSLSTKITFTVGNAPPCGSQTTAKFRYKRKDCYSHSNIGDPSIRAVYQCTVLDPLSLFKITDHTFCDGAPLYDFTGSKDWFIFGDSPVPIRKTTRLQRLSGAEGEATVSFSPVLIKGLSPDGEPVHEAGGPSGSFEVGPAATLTINGGTKDFLELIYEGSDLDRIEILGPDKLRVPTFQDYEAYLNGGPDPASTFFQIRVHYEDGTSRTMVPGFVQDGALDWTASDSYVVPPFNMGGGGADFGKLVHLHVHSAATLPPPFTLTVSYNDGERERSATKVLEYAAPDAPNLPDDRFSLSTHYEMMGAGGGEITVQVTATEGRPWTVEPQVPWITVVSGGAGSGDGTVVLEVDLNTLDYGRTGTVRIGPEELRVDQGFYYFPPVVQPAIIAAPAEGGDFTITVTAGDNTVWSAYSLTDWISVESGAVHQGDGQIVIRVATNSGGPRSGTVQVGGTVCTVNQAAGATGPEISVEQPAGTTLIRGTGQVNFGGVSVGQNMSLSFTIRNTGNTNLTGVVPSLVGGNAAEYTIITSPASTVPGGGFTICVVRFTPAAAGTRATTLRIPSNDSDENPFDIALTGTGVAIPTPEIAVSGNGTNIANGDATPSSADGTGFGGQVVGGSSLVHTFQIVNLGTATLNLTGSPRVSLIGSTAFSVTQQPSSTVAVGGGSRSFQIGFTPLASGLHTATVSIASNDADENPFTFVIEGVGKVPLLAVEQPVGTSLTSGSAVTNFGGVRAGTSSAPVVYTVRNSGDASLQIQGIATTGPDASDFTVSTSGTLLTLAPGVSTTFAVTFSPPVSETRTAILSIASNAGPAFQVSLVGSGIVPSSIDVTLPGYTVTATSTNHIASESPAQAIDNSAETKHLNYNGAGNGFTVTLPSPRVARALSAISANDFPERDPASFTLAGSHDGVTFVPVAQGTLSFPSGRRAFAPQVTFANDIAYAHYRLVFPTVKSTGAAVQVAEVELLEHPDMLAGAALTGTANLGNPSEGTAQLTDGLLGSKMGVPSGQTQVLTFVPGDAVRHLVPKGLNIFSGNDNSLYPGRSPRLVRMEGSNDGGQTWQIVYQKDNLPPINQNYFIDEHVFAANSKAFSTYRITLGASSSGFTQVSELQLLGAVPGTPQLVVEPSAGPPLVSGSAAMDFGWAFVGTSSPPAFFTVRNSGNAPLQLQNIIAGGAHAAEFAVNLSSTSLSVPPGSATSFSVIFTPAAAGARAANLTLNTNAGEPFLISLSGTGSTGAIVVEEAGGAPLIHGESTQDFGSTGVGGPGVVKTYVIRNAGSAPIHAAVSATGDFLAEISDLPEEIPPGNSASFRVSFHPSTAGPRAGTLRIDSDAANFPVFTFGLTGSGVAPAIVTRLNDFTPSGESRSVSLSEISAINDAGQIMASGLRATGTNDRPVLVSGSPGNLKVVAAANQAVPGGGSQVFRNAGFDTSYFCLGEDGRVAFHHGTDTNPNAAFNVNNFSIFLWESGRLRNVWLRGQAAPEGVSTNATGPVSGYSRSYQFLADRRLLYKLEWPAMNWQNAPVTYAAICADPTADAILHPGFGGGLETFASSEGGWGAAKNGEIFFDGAIRVPKVPNGYDVRSGLFHTDAGQALLPVFMQEGGYSFSGSIVCNDLGHLAFRAYHSGRQKYELFRWHKTLGTTLVATNGDPVPGLPGFTISNDTPGGQLMPERVTDDGAVIFGASLAGPNGYYGHALLHWKDGVTTLIAREKMSAHGAEELDWWNPIGSAVSRDGKVAIAAMNANGNDFSNYGLWYWEPGMGQPRLAARRRAGVNPRLTVMGQGEITVDLGAGVITASNFSGDAGRMRNTCGLLNRHGWLALKDSHVGTAMILDLRTLALGSAPTVANQPVGATVLVGGSHRFTVTTGGTLPQVYQWKKNGIVIPGATSDSLLIENYQAADAGNYTVTVANALGEVTSATAPLKDPSLPGNSALAYESFSYQDGGSIDTKGGGFGFVQPWSNVTGSVTTKQPGMGYTDIAGRVLHVSGHLLACDSTVTTAQAFRPLPDLSKAGTTLYVSFMGRQLNSSLRASSFAFFGGATGTTERFAIGHPTGQPANWGFGISGATTDPATAIPMTAPAFIVLRIDLNANGENERLRLYVNPPLDSEPTVPSLDNMLRNVVPDTSFADLKRIRPFAGGPPNAQPPAPSEWDEFRIGTSWADVTPFGVLQVSPSSAVPGSPLTLSWEVGRGATVLRLHPGNIDVTANTDLQTGMGSIELPAPAEGTVYSLAFTNNGIQRTLAAAFVTNHSPPPFHVRFQGDNLPSGSAILFGSTTAKSSTLREFVVVNGSSAPVKNLTISKAGDHLGDFTVETAPPQTLDPGASGVFAVSFSPREYGPRKGAILLSCEGFRDRPFVMLPEGTGVNASNAAVRAGPIVNPSNAHTYYLLNPASWTDSEAAAVSLGGHLATIRNAGEQAWMMEQFGSLGSLWIGLSDHEGEGNFRWASGEESSYTNFYPGEPNDADGAEDHVMVWDSRYGQPWGGRWNDIADINAYAALGVAEVTGGVKPFDAWKLFHFGIIASSGAPADLSDPDGDGSVNLLEYAFGTDPSHHEAGVIVWNISGLSPENRRLVLSYPRRKGATNLGITYIPEFSGTLEGDDWQPAAEILEVVPLDSEWERVTVADQASSKTKRFGRVRVSK